MPSPKIKPPKLSPAVKRARAALTAKGWSYRNAAPVLDVTWQHLAQVLTGRRESERLLRAIQELPETTPARRGARKAA